MEKKNLLNFDLQLFSEDGEVTDVEVSEAVEPTEETEESYEDDVETGEYEEDGTAEPQQSAEDNARYAAIRRRAEEDARRKYEGQMNSLNNQFAAMCQGLTHPVTGQPIRSVYDYADALQAQQRIMREQELEEKGVDPSLIDKMIESNPVVMQAKQVIEHSKLTEAESMIQRDVAEVSKYDPNIKGVQDLLELPNFPEILDRVSRGASLVDAYKMVNFDNFMQHTSNAARQQAINQMRGKSHLQSQGTGVATADNDVDVPAEIMSRWKAEGKTEKEISELYKTVTKKLNIS